MKRIVVSLLLVVTLLISSVQAFTTSPEWQAKLSEMWQWAEKEMGVENAIRPPVYISTPERFDPICHIYFGKEYDCDKVLGFYHLKLKVIHVRERPDKFKQNNTIVHEMTHALQLEIHGYKYMVDPENRPFLESEACLMGDIYSIESYTPDGQ